MGVEYVTLPSPYFTMIILHYLQINLDLALLLVSASFCSITKFWRIFKFFFSRWFSSSLSGIFIFKRYLNLLLVFVLGWSKQKSYENEIK